MSACGATRLRTPRIDSLAGRGLRFADAHSASATCTPSRYTLLTGEYAWRGKGTSVLPGDAGLTVAPGRTTLASMLRRAGYPTGVVVRVSYEAPVGDVAPGHPEVVRELSARLEKIRGDGRSRP